MRVTPAATPGVILLEPKVFGDDRGFFFERAPGCRRSQTRPATGLCGLPRQGMMILNALTNSAETHTTIMPKSGIINPKLGMLHGMGMDKQAGLGNALFSTTQQRVLGYLFGQPERSYFANELIALTGGGSGAVQREIKRLESSGLVVTERRGNQKHYQANPASPIYQELCGIVQKTFGLAEPLRMMLQDFAESIQAAFIFGSVAKKSDTAASDIDLMIISETLSYAEFYEKLAGVESFLGRQINPTVYSREQIQQRIAAENAFVTRVLAQPKIWLIGGEDAFTP